MYHIRSILFTTLFYVTVPISLYSAQMVQTAQQFNTQQTLDAQLFEALEKVDIETVKALLKQGANPNARNEKNHTPLMEIAFLAGSPKIWDTLYIGNCSNKSNVLWDIMDVLVKEYNADLTSQDNDGLTARQLAKKLNQNFAGNIAYLLARREHKVPDFVDLSEFLEAKKLNEQKTNQTNDQ